MSLDRHLTMSQIEELLSFAPSNTSQFEFNNFLAPATLGRARQFRAVLQEIQELEHKLTIATDRRKSTQKILDDLEVRYNWLKTRELSTIEASLKNFEAEEADYWINTIATQSAVDVLTGGKMSDDTIRKMMAMKKEDFYQIIFRGTKIANKVRTMMQDAEQAMAGEQVK